jgi:hypothetical protein
MKIELEPYKDILEYIDEKSITKKPLQIDLLVIKKPSNIKIENAIGKIFRAINIVEYKSPTDYLSIDDFYKVSAYAYLLKADADTEDGIPFGDLTISLVSSKAPKRVFEHLKVVRGYTLTKQEAGIYYLSREKDIPVQFIAVEELSSEHKWLVALTNQITEVKLTNITTDYNPAEKNEYKKSILDVVVKANLPYLKHLKEEQLMSEAWMELFSPEIEAAVEKRMQEADKRMQRMVIELNKMDINVTQIAKITELSEARVREILDKPA